MNIWLTEDEASKLVGRSKLTIRDWRTAGIVLGRKRKRTWEFERGSLLLARDQMATNYRLRRIVPGSGRGRFKPVDMDYLF